MGNYLSQLNGLQAALIAVDLSGAGSLALPGEAVRAAIQASFELLFAVDPELTRWLAGRAPVLRAEVDAEVAIQIERRSSEFMHTTDKESTRADLTNAAMFRRGMILVGEFTRSFSTTGMTIAAAVVDAVATFDAAIAAFVGDPSELAAAVAARSEFVRIGNALGTLPFAGDPRATPPLAQRDWLSMMLGDRW